MALELRWVGDDQRDLVSETRMRCYAHGTGDLPLFVERLRDDKRVKSGDFLLATRDGEPVGTATSIAFTMWVRGGPVPCQGVAYVGTIKTQRRKGGIATAVMNETLRAGRERGFVVSALMPFRGSYYEHFGYGFVERRHEWTLPMGVLPNGDFDDIRFYKPADFDDLVRFKLELTRRTHGDIERTPAEWERNLNVVAPHGHVVVDRAPGGPIRGYAYIEHVHNNGPDTVKVVQALYEDIPALRRLLHFFRSLRDQYSDVRIILPADLRLNLLLAETQLTHRANRNHPTPEARAFNRMQVRVLDHAKLLAAMKLPTDAAGTVVVGIHDVEGTTTKFAIEISDGRAMARPTNASAQVELPDRVWAPVVFGDLPASEAHRLGLLMTTDPRALAVLDIFARGPAPYCHEYF
jgi:predicted acetyltransferase